VNFSLDSAVQGEIENLVAMGTGKISLTGNDLANRLAGSAGVNHLDGGLGDDVLVGGKGADVFIFATGGGHDIITDFHPGADSIDLGGWDGFDSFNDVKTHLTVDGDDLVIASGADELTLRNTDKSDLRASDFAFA
jgi:Ca2+-binding RTX toxin-like protein